MSKSAADAMRDPCAFSPGEKHAKYLAQFYAAMFSAGSTVVDIGFGQGYFLEAARQRDIKAMGIDRDEHLVSNARDRGLDVHQADATEIAQLSDGLVDGVLAAHLIEHLTTVEVGRLLSEIAMVVRPGGLVVLVTPNFRDPRVYTEWFWNDPTHVRPYTSACIQQIIDPTKWSLTEIALTPAVKAWRSSPAMLVGKLRFGRHYGRPGQFFVLTRQK